MATRAIVQVARLELEQNTLRFKQLGTLERHDVSLEDVEKVFVRLSPHPDKQIIADVISRDTVYRCTEGKTLINYPTFLSDVAPGGLENYRRFVAFLVEKSAQQDPATEEFAAGKPPEAFASREEMLAYDAYLEGRESILPESAPTPSPVTAEAAADADVEKVWAEHAAQLRQEAAASSSGIDPRLGGYAMVALGGVIGIGGMLLMMAVLMHPDLGSNVSLIGILALCAFIGVVFMISGLVILRRAQQLAGDS